MTIHRHVFRKLVLSTILAGLPFAAVHAQDATAVADRFKKVMATQNIDVSWTAVSGTPSSMVLEGVKIAPTGAAKPAEIGKLTLEGVTEADGGFAIDKIKTDPYTMTEDGATIELSAIEMTGVKLPAEAAIDPMASIVFYDSVTMPSFAVKMGDKTAFSITDVAFELSPPEEGKPMEYSGSADSFTADLSLVQDPQSKAVIDALGYQTISGDFEMNGTWNPADGRLGLAQYDISVEDAGTFGMTVDLGGYTPDFIKSMRDMQKTMAAAPAGGDNSAQGLAMLGLMQQLTFHTASLRWDDDSLTGKVLEFVAKQQNMKVDDIKNQAKAILPFLTAQLNDPALSSQISAAVNTYLDDPKSLEIAANPAAPVPFAQIAASATTNPLELPKTLGVSVTANAD